jgi:hypothetical protein
LESNALSAIRVAEKLIDSKPQVNLTASDWTRVH